MDYIATYRTYLKTMGYNTKTIRQKIKHLITYLNYLKKIDVLKVTHQNVLNYYKYLNIEKAGCKQVTINYYMTTLRLFYDWLQAFNYITIHPCSQLVLNTVVTKYTRKPISEAFIIKLWKNTQFDYEKLILIFGYGCGLRAKELSKLSVGDIDFTHGILKVQKGKNNKRRSIPLQAAHLQYLYHYKINEGLSNQHTFFKVTTHTLRTYFKALQNRLGKQRPYYCLHHLRHSIASHLVDHNVSIELVQCFLGHASLATTQVYVTPSKSLKTWTI